MPWSQVQVLSGPPRFALMGYAWHSHVYGYWAEAVPDIARRAMAGYAYPIKQKKPMHAASAFLFPSLTFTGRFFSGIRFSLERKEKVDEYQNQWKQ